MDTYFTPSYYSMVKGMEYEIREEVTDPIFMAETDGLDDSCKTYTGWQKRIYDKESADYIKVNIRKGNIRVKDLNENDLAALGFKKVSAFDDLEESDKTGFTPFKKFINKEKNIIIMKYAYNKDWYIVDTERDRTYVHPVRTREALEHEVLRKDTNLRRYI